MIDSVTETFFSLAYEKIEATLQECIINMATLLKWLISNFFRYHGSTRLNTIINQLSFAFHLI